MPNNKRRYRGNVKAQQKRRAERRKRLPERLPETVELIDGNKSYYPVARCRMHGGYLSLGLLETHRCVERKCGGFVPLEDDAADTESLPS